MTTVESAPPITQLVDHYLDAWNELDDGARRRLIVEVWAPDASLVDPPLTGEGYDGIDAMSVALHQHYPGCTFRRASGIDEHHGRFRFGWELVGPDGTAVMSGIDVGELAEDGRIARITGFFGELPAHENGAADG